jgi:hypothetical protein
MAQEYAFSAIRFNSSGLVRQFSPRQIHSQTTVH